MLKKQILAKERDSKPSDKIRVRKALSSLAEYDIINGSHINMNEESANKLIIKPIVQSQIGS